MQSGGSVFLFCTRRSGECKKKNSPLHTRKGNSENGQMLLKMYPCIDRRRRSLGHALCFAMVDSEIKISKTKKRLPDIKRNNSQNDDATSWIYMSLIPSARLLLPILKTPPRQHPPISLFGHRPLFLARLFFFFSSSSSLLTFSSLFTFHSLSFLFFSLVPFHSFAHSPSR